MASSSLQRKVLVLYLFLFLSASALFSCALSQSQSESKSSLATRRLLHEKKEEAEEEPLKNQSSIPSILKTKTKTKILKPVVQPPQQLQIKKLKFNSTKTTSKPTTPSPSSKDQLKKLDSTSNSTKTTPIKNQVKKLNATSKVSKTTPFSKTQQLTKLNSTKKSSPDPTKPIAPPNPKNKTAKPNTKIASSKQTHQLDSDPKSKNRHQKQKTQKPQTPKWMDGEEDVEDLVSGLRDLPYRFQQTLLPDLHRISTTSKAYITRANKEITNNFKPIVGNKYAPAFASSISVAFLLIPLILVSLLVNRIKAHFSIQRLLIFVQAYLWIYFSILCLSSLATGLEPLRFLYATSQATYVCVQLLQTLAYVIYLLLLLMYLVLLFSTHCGLGSRLLGLGQTFLGYAVGLHYYVAVFHRAVLHQPPKTNWKVHGIYATCFLIICLLARAEWRKKTYVEASGDENKKN